MNATTINVIQPDNTHQLSSSLDRHANRAILFRAFHDFIRVNNNASEIVRPIIGNKIRSSEIENAERPY